MKYPPYLLKLIESLKRLPGVGAKTAERFAFKMLDWRPDQLREFAEIIEHIPDQLKRCGQCGCLGGSGPCFFCDPSKRQPGQLCIIASPKDAFAVEKTGEFKGHYYVLGTLLSPLEGIGADCIDIMKLRSRIQELSVRELIVALDSTLEGDATALFLKRELEDLSLKISRLAFGLPIGSSFDYVDDGTLARAFSGRGNF